MKLKIVPARTGALWVRLGIQTFFKQPLALTGLFFLFMAIMQVASMVPKIGLVLAMTFLPAATLGLMAATREATQGRFPMPAILWAAFRAGQQQARAMLTLGGMYAIGFMVAIGASWLADDGHFARLYLGGGAPDTKVILTGEFQLATWVFIGLHLPLSLLFWHAPALVHWQNLSPAKSMFFSFVACLRNFWAYAVFGLCWMGVLILAAFIVLTLSALMGSAALAGHLLSAAAMLVAAMFFTSLYFTFRDSFEPATED